MSAAAVADVSAGVKFPRSRSSATIGCARTIRPMVAGTLSIIIRRRASETVRRIAGRSDAPAWREISGSAAVPIDTPNSPIGRYIMRNA
jgi:hypothetical protein